MGIVSNGSFWIYDVEELRSQDPNWPTHEGWGEQSGFVVPTLDITFVVPDGVESISVVLQASGGAGNVVTATNTSRIGGGGGQLRYMNDIPVTPGDTYIISSRTAPGFGCYTSFRHSANSLNDPMFVALPGMHGTFLDAVNENAYMVAGTRMNGVGGGADSSLVSNALSVFNLTQASIDNADGGGAGGTGYYAGAGGAGGYSGTGGQGGSYTTNLSQDATAAPAAGTGAGAGAQGYRYISAYGYSTYAGGTWPYGLGERGFTTNSSVYGPFDTSQRRYRVWPMEYGGPKPASQTTNPLFDGVNYGYGLRLAGSGSEDSMLASPPPRYKEPGVYGSYLWPALYTLMYEHGLMGAGQVNRGFFTLPNSNATYDISQNPFFITNSGHYRITWPGRVRKFPSQHVQYVPNPGSVWKHQTSPNLPLWDRNDWSDGDYDENGVYSP